MRLYMHISCQHVRCVPAPHQHNTQYPIPFARWKCISIAIFFSYLHSTYDYATVFNIRQSAGLRSQQKHIQLICVYRVFFFVYFEKRGFHRTDQTTLGGSTILAVEFLSNSHCTVSAKLDQSYASQALYIVYLTNEN